MMPSASPKQRVLIVGAKFGAHNQYALFWGGGRHHNVFSGCVEVAQSQRVMCCAQA